MEPTSEDPGRRVSDAYRAGTEEAVLLTEFSVRAIGLYQKQAELADRLWSYFGSMSFFAIILSLAAPIFRQRELLPPTGAYLEVLLLLIVVAYWAFSVGNRSALRQSQEALERIAAQAQMASGIKLRVVRPRDAAFFHTIVSLITLLSLTVGFAQALGFGSFHLMPGKYGPG